MSEPSVDKKGEKRDISKETPATPTPQSLQELAGGGLPQVLSSSKDFGKISILSSFSISHSKRFDWNFNKVSDYQKSYRRRWTSCHTKEIEHGGIS
jgi:hypothetical protein